MLVDFCFVLLFNHICKPVLSYDCQLMGAKDGWKEIEKYEKKRKQYWKDNALEALFLNPALYLVFLLFFDFRTWDFLFLIVKITVED